MSEWQPIETAPMDGTVFLAYWPQVEDGRFASKYLPSVYMTWRAKWTPEDPGRWHALLPVQESLPYWPDNTKVSATPSHWMPVPLGPLCGENQMNEAYRNPGWEKATRVHDWRNYANEEIRSMWATFTPEQRAALQRLFEDMASREEWD